jgi:hypothetical protein
MQELQSAPTVPASNSPITVYELTVYEPNFRTTGLGATFCLHQCALCDGPARVRHAFPTHVLNAESMCMKFDLQVSEYAHRYIVCRGRFRRNNLHGPTQRQAREGQVLSHPRTVHDPRRQTADKRCYSRFVTGMHTFFSRGWLYCFGQREDPRWIVDVRNGILYSV